MHARWIGALVAMVWIVPAVAGESDLGVDEDEAAVLVDGGDAEDSIQQDSADDDSADDDDTTWLDHLEPPPADDGDGCQCRVAPRTTAAGLGVLTALALAGLMRRRR